MASDALRKLIELKRSNPYDPKKTIQALREVGADAGSEPREGTEVASVDAKGVPAEWVVNGVPDTDTVFMFLHGGGYYRGSAQASRRIASDLSAACHCKCITVDYRLAPEHPFPAALDDAFNVYCWLESNGIPASRIVVGGSSAGGGLSAALLARLKRESRVQPAAAILLSPWTDLTQSAETFASNAASDPAISKAYLDRMALAYLDGVSPTDPRASPVYSDLSGLPPLLVQVGNSETMYGDALAFVAKARSAGVEVALEEYDDVIHGWHNSAHTIPNIPETLRAFEQIGDFFKEIDKR